MNETLKKIQKHTDGKTKVKLNSTYICKECGEPTDQLSCYPNKGIKNWSCPACFQKQKEAIHE